MTQSTDYDALTEAEREALWRHVKIAPSPHDREQIEASVAELISARTASLRAALDVVDSLTSAAEYRSRVSLSRDHDGNPPVGLVPAPDLRAVIPPVSTDH